MTTISDDTIGYMDDVDDFDCCEHGIGFDTNCPFCNAENEDEDGAWSDVDEE